MAGIRWSCKELAVKLLDTAKQGVRDLNAIGIRPHVAVIQVGDHASSGVYNRSKLKTCESIGMLSSSRNLPATATQSQLMQEIHELNKDPEVHGILVQLPLPAQLDHDAVFSAVDPYKDIDGFHPVNAGHLSLGQDGLFPCTPLGIMHLIIASDIKPCHTVILGRSNVVGKPMAQLLLRANFTPTVIHTRTPNAKEICKTADLIISATGQPGLIEKSWVKPGASIIDVGITEVTSKEDLERVVPRRTGKKWEAFQRNGRVLVGDVKYDEVLQVAERVTPVPGGVGVLTNAQLVLNCLKAASLQLTPEQRHASRHHTDPNGGISKMSSSESSWATSST